MPDGDYSVRRETSQQAAHGFCLGIFAGARGWRVCSLRPRPCVQYLSWVPGLLHTTVPINTSRHVTPHTTHTQTHHYSYITYITRTQDTTHTLTISNETHRRRTRSYKSSNLRCLCQAAEATLSHMRPSPELLYSIVSHRDLAAITPPSARAPSFACRVRGGCGACSCAGGRPLHTVT